MNDWSGRSESGWTMYLDQSYTSDHRGGRRPSYREKGEEEEEEEEDLSMVSDASSGPQHYIESNEQCFNNNGYSSSYYSYSASESSALNCRKKEDKMKKKKPNNNRNKQSSYLDDTASSHVYGCAKTSKTNAASSHKDEVEFSQGFSATHFKRKSAERKYYGFYGCEKSGAEE